MISILEGIVSKANKGTTVLYKRANLKKYAEEIEQGFMEEVKKADAFIAVMGITPQYEGEEGADAEKTGGEGDRRDITLPDNQVRFIKNLSELPVPLILILTAGSPLAISDIHDIADAVLYVWYPGEEGGNAVGDIIFGNESPSGKLPVTFPRSIEQIPDFTDYSMKNRTYRYMQEEPLYPFGFGLSYTRFTYSNLTVNPGTIHHGESVAVSVTVTNTGNYESDEVVQLYLQHPDASCETPFYSLKGFKRIHLKAGENKIVQFTLTPGVMAIINNNGTPVIEKGKVVVYIGGFLPGRRSQDLGGTPCISAEFLVT